LKVKKDPWRRKRIGTALKKLEASPFFDRECESLVKRLKSDSTTGIIAEFKRRSPSKGIINDKAEIADVVRDYENYGAAWYLCING
jgi:indole-3-glycerol phosphate synthase